jgi:hypothetical protein
MSRSTPTDDHGSLDNFCTPANPHFYRSKIYADLDRSKHEIRVLQLSPVQENTPMSASLKTISLNALEAQDDSTFIAISYAAGSYEETEVIYVNGTRFNAFANLARALRQAAQARQKTELEHCPELIWADQICINQSNPVERAHQVGFMRNIYQSAKVVLACLGDDPSNGRCIEAVERLQCWSGLFIDLDDTKVLANGQMVADFRDEEFRQDWSALEELLRCQWWQRGWVYQEVVVARQVFVLFGDCIFDWETLSNTIRSVVKMEQVVIGHLLKDDMDICQVVLNIVIFSGLLFAEFMVDGRRDSAPTREKDLIGLLADARVCKVSDPRDRIFAFVGLVDPGYCIVPDYTVSPAAVFSLACKRIILYEQNLNILTCCKEDLDSHARLGDLPSWTPDWSKPEKLSFNLIYDPVHDFPPFRASKAYLSAATFLANDDHTNGVLRVQCLFIDNVATETSLGPQSNGEHQSLEDWKHIIDSKYDSDDSGYTPNQWTTPFETFLGVILRGRKGLVDEEGDTHKQRSLIVNDTKQMGRIFRSPNGYVGVTKGEADVRHTDWICVLLGANVPFILRKVDEHLVLVSDAYVEGLMYGEAIDLARKGELDIVTVDIH